MQKIKFDFYKYTLDLQSAGSSPNLTYTKSSEIKPQENILSGKSNKSVKTNGQNDQTADIRNYFNFKKQKSDRGVT